MSLDDGLTFALGWLSHQLTETAWTFTSHTQHLFLMHYSVFFIRVFSNFFSRKVLRFNLLDQWHMSFQLLNLKIKLVFLKSSFQVLHTAIFEHACVITSEFLEFYFSVFVYDFVSHIILVINNWRWSIRFSYMRSAFILFQLLFCKLLNHFFNVVWIG